MGGRIGGTIAVVPGLEVVGGGLFGGGPRPAVEFPGLLSGGGPRPAVEFPGSLSGGGPRPAVEFPGSLSGGGPRPAVEFPGSLSGGGPRPAVEFPGSLSGGGPSPAVLVSPGFLPGDGPFGPFGSAVFAPVPSGGELGLDVASPGGE